MILPRIVIVCPLIGLRAPPVEKSKVTFSGMEILFNMVGDPDGNVNLIGDEPTVLSNADIATVSLVLPSAAMPYSRTSIVVLRSWARSDAVACVTSDCAATRLLELTRIAPFWTAFPPSPKDNNATVRNEKNNFILDRPKSATADLQSSLDDQSIAMSWLIA
jgi:hypothetical protein